MAHDSECVPLFRWGRGFSEQEIQRRLAALPECPSTAPLSDEHAARDRAWKHYYSEALIARELPGQPQHEGKFEKARQAILDYEFSDPDIVTGHFERAVTLKGRPMALELKVLGVHVLCGAVIRAVRDTQTAEHTVWGYRYDTVAAHVESGSEWFLLSKDHLTGEVRFRIQAAWREGTLPTWWSRVGFHLFAHSYQRAWHRHAYLRLRTLLQARDLPDLPHNREILKVWQPLIGGPLNEIES